MIADLAFGISKVQSDGYGFTLAAKRWFQKYWHPINSLGYRDYEHDWDSNTLFIVGDSFVAGHGIDHIEDRMSSVLASKLGDEWNVAIIAKNGWALDKQYQALINHPQRPDEIILSYYINDIESAARTSGLELPQLIELPNPLLNLFIDNSFILNWFYWIQYRSSIGGVYWEYLKQAYSDPDIWQQHLNEINKIIDYAEDINAPLRIIVWPNLLSIDESSEFTEKVVGYLNSQGLDVIHLTEFLSGRDPLDMIVNRLDGHPNTSLSKEVAELAYQQFFSGK